MYMNVILNVIFS